MNNWLKHCQDWLLPRSCVLCAGDAGTLDLCRWCFSALPRIVHGCEGCGIPIASGDLCAACLHGPSLFDRVCIPYRYEPPLSSLILRLKFQRRVEMAAPLGAVLVDSMRARPAPPPDVIVPVPLHAARLRQRGFNQALEIARPLSKSLGLPLAPRLVKRLRDTAAQSSLADPVARRGNVRGAFEVNKERCARIAHAAIVDDVVTTGATVNEIARTLRRAGIARVDLWSLARVTVD